MRRLFLLLMLVSATALGNDLFVPAAGRVTGANDTFFRTDLRIVNLAASSATVELTWLSSGVDNSGATPVEITIQPRSADEIDDVAGTLFGLDGATGAIHLTSMAPIVASSRTYTSSANCPGTLGQFIPAVDITTAFAQGIIPNVELSADKTSGFRTNAGVLNPSLAPVDVTLHLRNGDGSDLGSTQLTLRPLEQLQNSVASFFAQDALTTSNAFIEVAATAPVFAFISVIDNQSGDSIYVPASADVGSPSSAITMTAHQWSFEPSTVTVSAGKSVTFQIHSTDVEHGIFFSGVGPVTCSSEQGGECFLEPNVVVTVTFTPSKTGTFAFFCTRFCGSNSDGSQGHATMRGTLIVE